MTTLIDARPADSPGAPFDATYPATDPPPSSVTSPLGWSHRIGARPAAVIVAIYVLLMPFLAGLPRGLLVPHLRPSETLQFAATAGAVALLAPSVARGEGWRLRIRRSEWCLLAVAVAASVVPLLWLAARAQPVGTAEILAAFPFVKFAALYVLARAAVCSSGDARAILAATTTAGLVVAAIAVAQSLGVRPILDVLGQYYTNDDAVTIDAGRGSTTVGSSIATGMYLAIGATVALSMGFASRRPGWFVAASVLTAGSLASGQVSIAIGLVASLLVVGWLHGRARQLVAWGIPALLLGVAGLWPIVSARLAAIDDGSGLPSSWVVRWVNVTELYWPRLADGGWLLGVSPDATQAPPDVWRDIVYLESGYLWLLWVGGVPLLVAAFLFLHAAYRDLGVARATAHTPTVGGLAAAAQAAVVLFALLTVLDPHLTLRASADLFFVLLALGAATVPFAEPRPAPHRQWRALLGADQAVDTGVTDVRIRVGEAPLDVRSPIDLPDLEQVLRVDVRSPADRTACMDLALIRRGSELHAIATQPGGNANPAETAVMWRGLVRCAASLRLASLTFVDNGRPLVAQRGELKLAAGLADRLESERLAYRRDPSRPRRQNPTDGAAGSAAGQLPVRIELRPSPPAWKRTTDLILGLSVAVVAAPVAGVCALLVLRSGPGPIVFRQVRVGAGGLPFQMFKFRTMHVGNDDRAVRNQNEQELLGVAEGSKDANDGRVTPVGRWLRRLSLDELPQLVNVVRGEMSLVGPRPSLLWEVELFAPSSRRRLEVNPGVTGLWQTSGRGDLSMLEMLELDVHYVDSVSASVDLRCLTATARSVIEGKGAA